MRNSEDTLQITIHYIIQKFLYINTLSSLSRSFYRFMIQNFALYQVFLQPTLSPTHNFPQFIYFSTSKMHSCSLFEMLFQEIIHRNVTIHKPIGDFLKTLTTHV